MRGPLLLLLTLVAAQAAADPLQPALDLLGRLVSPAVASSFELSLDSDSCDEEAECATLETAKENTIAIAGTSVNAVTFGIGTYLKRYCNVSLSWVKTGGMERARQIGKLPPVPGKKVTVRRIVKWTYYQNVVMSSYSFAWWDWSRWQVELDWMALHGINLALMYTGQEAVLMRTYKKFGIDLSKETGYSAFFNGPAYLSWSRGQGQADVGGYDAFMNGSSSPDTARNSNVTGSLPSWWLDGQEALGKQIASRMRELGITTILRGFEGNVPEGLKALYPKANISSAYSLDALDPLFGKIADSYMQDLIATFGTDHYYQADGFFSNGKAPWYNAHATTSDFSGSRSRSESGVRRISCEWTTAMNNTYIAGCAGGDNIGCGFYSSLAEAEAACAALPAPTPSAPATPTGSATLARACSGVTFQYGGYTLRRAHTTTASPQGKPSTSWLISNPAQCQGPAPKPSPTPSPTPVPPDAGAKAHSEAAYAGLSRTDPKAVWVYQTWIWREFDESKLPFLSGWLSGIPKGRSLLLDQTAEWVPLWSKFDFFSFFGTDFVWCAMLSMGGNLGLYGDLTVIAEQPVEALNHPNSSMVGVGIDPEGIDQNPAYYTLLLESAWRIDDSVAAETAVATAVATSTTTALATPVNVTPMNVSSFIGSWATQRCGGFSTSADRAWKLLQQTVYANSPTQTYEHHMKYCPTTMPLGSGWDTPMIRPNTNKYSPHGTGWYTASMLHEAWGLLLDAAEGGECGFTSHHGEGRSDQDGHNAAFVFDLVDVGREFLSIFPCVSAYDALTLSNSTSALMAANESMTAVMDDIDTLLGSSDGFLLGSWIRDARKMAPLSSSVSAPDDNLTPSSTFSWADFLEWNARSQVTAWKPSVAAPPSPPTTTLAGLWDYGNKAWAGLVGPYYGRRYQIFAKHQLEAITSKKAFEKAAYYTELMEWAYTFAHRKWNQADVPASAAGDAVVISRAMWSKYKPACV